MRSADRRADPDDADSNRAFRLTALLLLPALLGVLVLAAHFLRDGNLVAVVLLVAMVPLLGLRRRWIPRVFQVILGLGSLEWLRTLLALRSQRMALGLPHTRMVAILGGVAVFTALAAALFEVPPIRDWYRGGAGAGRAGLDGG